MRSDDPNGAVSVEVVVSDPMAQARSRTSRIVTTLRLTWRPDDPLAVVLHLTSTPDHPALPSGTWVVLRDFLRYGLEQATGDGAVRIQPADDPSQVALRLLRHARPVWVGAPRDVVRGFLDETERRCPAGEEASEEALDALIQALLRH